MDVEECGSFGWNASNVLHFLPGLDLGLAEMRRMINDCEEDEKENQGVMMTSNAGEADKAEFSPLPSPQTGALPSHHHLLYILTIGADYKVDD